MMTLSSSSIKDMTLEEKEQEIMFCIKNGLYAVAIKALSRREKFIYKNIAAYKGKKWLRTWLADNLLRGQKVSIRYRLVVEDILETKYEVE